MSSVDELADLNANQSLYEEYGAEGKLPVGRRVQILEKYWDESVT